MRAALLLLAGCAGPDVSELFVDAAPFVPADAAEGDDAFVRLADGAAATLDVALPTVTDPDLVDALVAAHDRGVDVRLVVDAQAREDDGVVDLVAADVDVRFADDALGYFDFGINNTVGWTGDQVRMTHAFVIADRVRWVAASRAGDLDAGPRVVFEGRGEDVGEVLGLEHAQVFGGTDATSLDAYNAVNKSIPDPRWRFPTASDEVLDVFFGPQDRLVKRVIDGVYAARSSVRVVTDDLADDGLAAALQAKAEDGFDVEVIVGPGFGLEVPGASQVLRDATPAVRKLSARSAGRLPTIVYLDFDVAADGFYHRPRALVLTHELISAGRLRDGQPVASDQTIDGTLMVLSVADVPPSPPLQALAAIYEDLLDVVEVLP